MTGAYGFVGANLVRRLLADGHEVHALGRPGSDPWRLREVADSVVAVAADLVDETAIGRLMADVKPEWVFHLAAYGGYSWQADVRAALEVNAVGTAVLAEAASRTGVEALVHAGSSSEYGFQTGPPAESERPEPNSAYAVGKLAATTYCAHVARRDRRRMVTLRLYSVYGPYEEPGRLVPTLVARGLRGELPPLVDPDTARDFVYVEDVSDAFVRAAEADIAAGAIFNIGSGRQTTIDELVQAARRVLAIDAEPSWGGFPARAWDTDTWVSDPRRAEEELGWSATTSVEEGLELTASWMRTSPAAVDRYEAGDAA